MWSLKKLEKILKDNGVDISKWGKGEAKTLNHLLQELIKDECKLEIKDGKVIRIVHALSINVIYKGEVLKEEYQRFKDGRIRKRKMDCSVAEKIHDDEIKDLNKAVKRALSEELRIKDISDDQITKLPQISRTRPSGSYPGTDMDMVLYKFNVVLKYHQYDPHGYVEHQEDKDTYFVWMQNSNLKRYGWKTNEGIRLSKTAHNKQKKELLNIQHLKKELKLIEPVLTDLEYDVLYTTTPWTSGDFSLTISIYDRKKDPNYDKSLVNLEEYEEFKDRVWDLCDSLGYKCETMGKFGSYIEIKKIPHVSKTKKILEGKYENVILERNAKLCNVRDGIKNISHVLNDVGIRIEAYLCQASPSKNGEFICLKLLKHDEAYGWISSTLIWEMEECGEFLDRLNEICEKNGLAYFEPPKSYGSFLMIGKLSFDIERFLSVDLYYIITDDSNIFFDVMI